MLKKTLTIKEGTKVSELPTPNAVFPEVYTFKGYGLDEIGDDVVSKDYVIKDNDTLFAKFDRNLKEDIIYILFEAVPVSRVQPVGINTFGFITTAMEPDEELYSYECSDPDAIANYQITPGARSTFEIGFEIKPEYAGHLIFKIKGPLNSIEFAQAKVNKDNISIGDHRLYAPGNINIKAVCLNTITDRLKFSGDGPFCFLDNLRFIDYVGENINTVPRFTFYNCSSLKYVPYMPVIEETMSLSAFNGCTHLSNFRLPEKVGTIENACFANCHGLTKVKLPYATKAISNEAFLNCINLKEIDFTNTNFIGTRQFANCTSLETINISNTVYVVNGESFINCTNLKSVTFESGSNPLTLNPSNFRGCNKLKTLKLPRQTTTITDNLLAGSVIDVLDLSSIDTFFDYVNLGTDNPITNKKGKIIVKKELLPLYQNDPSWQTIKEVFVAA